MIKFREKLSRQAQMSDAFVLSLLLAFSGGFQDAYTYIVRAHVFANAQTGNVVLMSTHFLRGQWREGVQYLFPLLAFTAGIIAAENMRHFFGKAKVLHWRQSILLIEIGILFLVGWMPLRWNTAANCLISFSCALQVQSFRKVCGHAYASTMCIGNLRSGAAALSAYVRTKEKTERRKAAYYFGVILIFALGAGLGGNLSMLWQTRTIWCACAVLTVCFLLMELDRKSK